MVPADGAEAAATRDTAMQLSDPPSQGQSPSLVTGAGAARAAGPEVRTVTALSLLVELEGETDRWSRDGRLPAAAAGRRRR